MRNLFKKRCNECPAAVGYVWLDEFYMGCAYCSLVCTQAPNSSSREFNTAFDGLQLEGYVPPPPPVRPLHQVHMMLSKIHLFTARLHFTGFTVIGTYL